MSDNDKMTIAERYKYLRKMRKRYEEADKREKGRLLDEMEEFTGQHRKTLIRAMGGDLQRQVRRRQRGSSYGAELDETLRVVAESLDYICAERMTPCLVATAQRLAAHGELQLTPQLLQDLARVSVSTVRRHLQRLHQDQPRLCRKRAVVTNRLIGDIPMKRISWQQVQPGHFEVDLVHHGGASASGEYIHTLQMIDVATGWSERVAVLGRSYQVMQAGFQHCFARLPFLPREIHPDNGSEFFNAHVMRFLRTTYPDIQLSRSRPYHKNDNRCVEQKNASLVRAYIGYDRFDTVQHTRLLNLIYDQMWLYYNFFQPVMRLQEKTSAHSADGSLRVQRRFDTAQTPFDRLCASQMGTGLDLRRLHTLREQTNPRQLRQDIYALLDAFFALPAASPGPSQNVYETFPIPFTLMKGEVDYLVALSNG